MGKRFSLVCVAEGAKPLGGEIVTKGSDIKTNRSSSAWRNRKSSCG